MKTSGYFTLLVLILLLSGCGMDKSVLYFKDGSQKTGTGKIMFDNKVKFKENASDSKTSYYTFNEVKKVRLHEKTGDIIDYVSVKVKGYENSLILREIKTGKVSLYKKITQRVNYIPTGGGFGGFGGGPMMVNTYNITDYYVKFDDEPEATHLGSNSLFSKNFKKAASEFFKDCSNLVEKIQSGEYKKQDIEIIVTYYNTMCK